MSSENNSSQRPETVAIHGEKKGRTPAAGDPVVPPRVNSTIFRFSEDPQPGDLVYTRHQNPNRDQLERVLASLEGGESCAAFSSGMAAASAIFQSLNPGDHLLLPLDLYHGVRTLANQVMGRWGLEVEAIDMTDIALVKSSLRPETAMVWLETPSNPLLQITDIEAITEICRKRNVDVVVDNTWPTPLGQQPLGLGADLVLHSTSKYIGGHSDLLGGAVIGRDGERLDTIRQIQTTAGAVPSPDDCWLMLRSIRTLPLRMRGHHENAQRMAILLDQDSRVERVFYPGLANHPGHQIARKQMSAYGGMISFLVKGGREKASRVVQGSRLIAAATSLGGVESLWEHRILSETPESETPEHLIRFSVGLEHSEDLMADIDHALNC
ncbi:MAG: aminotransferase class I/II-fold pyridoxal phosphate-dependent enzyme [Balneolaceae bacterium]